MSAARKIKGAKVKKEPSVEKQPKKALEPSSFHNRRVSWRISHIEMEGPYGWHEIDIATLEYLRSKLSSFESMTWGEVFKQKKKHHSILINDIISPAKKRLEAIGQDDVDKLVSLSLSNTNRIWGILEEGVLRLIWWDPNHEICPSEKKHT